MAILDINNLVIKFKTNDGLLTAVNGFNCSLQTGQTLGIVGESGSGKSQTVLSILGLLAKNAVVSGEILFENQDLLKASAKDIRQIRGNKIAMIFQDPMTCLNPYMTVGKQLMENLFIHKNTNYKEARRIVLECMDAVRISEAVKRFDQYPNEFSGGMRQRLMIAMAILCKPKLLIADEPTTALDVTVQAEIMNLLNDLKKEFNMTIILITHDLGLVAGQCDEVIVLYGGRIMEKGKVDDIFYQHKHPYTIGLLNSIPKINQISDKNSELMVIPGNPPSLLNLPKGCPFNARCNYRILICGNEMPLLKNINKEIQNINHAKACHVEISNEQC